MLGSREIKINLRPKVVCPHCWENCPPEDLLWVSTHPQLLGDPKLGAEEQSRFLPTRFDPDGAALDVMGSPCIELACPSCHLVVPRAALELGPLIVSVAGTPASGKSYFLAASAWSLRKKLPKHYGISFSEADPAANVILNAYEEQQFLNPDRDAIVRLAKTEEQGDLYSAVQIEDRVVQYPKPFLFSLRPSGGPEYEARLKKSRLLCLYDNAGESFLPGKDTADNRVTGHLWRSDAVLYLYDPTQDIRFRQAVQQQTGEKIQDDGVVTRQETVLHEIAQRLKRHRAVTDQDRQRPLVIVLTKYDQWWPLLGHERLPEPEAPYGSNGDCRFNLDAVKHVSDAVRDLLNTHSPELVAAADEFSDEVWCIPVSATGCPPEADPKTGRLGFRPRNLKPMWESVPMLTVLATATTGLLPLYAKRTKSARSEGAEAK